MKIISRIIWSILFVVAFGLALKNMHEVAASLFLGYEIRSPLALILLGFLSVGFALGVLAMTPTFVRQRRALARQGKTIDLLQKENEARQLARSQPPPPDTIVGV